MVRNEEKEGKGEREKEEEERFISSNREKTTEAKMEERRTPPPRPTAAKQPPRMSREEQRRVFRRKALRIMVVTFGVLSTITAIAVGTANFLLASPLYPPSPSHQFGHLKGRQPLGPVNAAYPSDELFFAQDGGQLQPLYGRFLTPLPDPSFPPSIFGFSDRLWKLKSWHYMSVSNENVFLAAAFVDVCF